jgi:hypothetical protein
MIAPASIILDASARRFWVRQDRHTRHHLAHAQATYEHAIRRDVSAGWPEWTDLQRARARRAFVARQLAAVMGW